MVEKAFNHLSGLTPAQLVPVEATLPSPLQYAYRTKLTPHFELPPPSIKDPAERLKELAIGFEIKGRRKCLDIEECPIATETVNAGLTRERAKVHATLGQFKRGATLLLRHSQDGPAEPVCISDHKAIVQERVAGYKFEFAAGTFFQNNNGILESLVLHIAKDLHVPKPEEPPAYLVDAYCGSGLFSICLAKYFSQVSGVEISTESVKFAEHNAELNAVTNTEFLAGKAEAIFEVGCAFLQTLLSVR